MINTIMADSTWISIIFPLSGSTPGPVNLDWGTLVEWHDKQVPYHSKTIFLPFNQGPSNINKLTIRWECALLISIAPKCHICYDRLTHVIPTGFFLAGT